MSFFNDRKKIALEDLPRPQTRKLKIVNKKQICIRICFYVNFSFHFSLLFFTFLLFCALLLGFVQEKADLRSNNGFYVNCSPSLTFFYSFVQCFIRISLEKSKSSQKTITCLRKTDNTVTTDPHEILEECRKFYMSLLS